MVLVEGWFGWMELGRQQVPVGLSNSPLTLKFPQQFANAVCIIVPSLFRDTNALGLVPALRSQWQARRQSKADPCYVAPLSGDLSCTAACMQASAMACMQAIMAVSQ
jgi:hypothetical protein